MTVRTTRIRADPHDSGDDKENVLVDNVAETALEVVVESPNIEPDHSNQIEETSERPQPTAAAHNQFGGKYQDKFISYFITNSPRTHWNYRARSLAYNAAQAPRNFFSLELLYLFIFIYNFLSFYRYDEK